MEFITPKFTKNQNLVQNQLMQTHIRLMSNFLEPVPCNVLFRRFQIILPIKATVSFVETDPVCHVWCNVWPSYTCRSAVIFRTLKDDSLWINILASNNCFSYRNIFQNGVNTLSKLVNHFLSKAQNFVWFGPYDFVQISPALCSKYLSNNVWRDFGLPMWPQIMNSSINKVELLHDF